MEPSGEDTQTIQFDKHFASIQVCLPLKLANSSNTKKRTRLLVIFLSLPLLIYLLYCLFSLLFSDTRATHLSIHMASSGGKQSTAGRGREERGATGGQKIEFCSTRCVSFICARPSGNLNNSRILPKGTDQEHPRSTLPPNPPRCLLGWTTRPVPNAFVMGPSCSRQECEMSK